MSVTDEDREKAMFALFPELAYELPSYIAGLTFSDDAEANIASIAAALAAEREKARAPFLAVADELDRQSERADANSGSGYLTNEHARGCATAFEMSADRIRLAAQDQP